MVKFDLTSAFMLAVPHLVAEAESTTQFNPIESLFSAILPRQAPKNGTKILDPFAPTPEEREAEKQARRRRMRERNERVKETFKNIKPEKLEKVPQEQLEKMDGNLRKLSWSKANSGENSYLVDPGEEKLKNEFSGVKRSYIPLQSIVRIDEVDKEGAARISEGGTAKIAPFPVTPQPLAPSQGDD